MYDPVTLSVLSLEFWRDGVGLGLLNASLFVPYWLLIIGAGAGAVVVYRRRQWHSNW